VTTDADGKTRFGEMTIDFTTVEGVSPGGVFQAAPLGTSDAAVVQFEPGFTCDFHHTPAPTWMFIMTGQMEIEVSDGAKELLSSGDLIRMEDADGEGHRSRVLSDGPVLMATAGFNAA
jgi:uncharacterized cupin superfamily protein